MATFILVHGSFHGGWCWERVADHLRKAGHRAMAPDLPGMGGADQTPPQAVTLALTAAFVAEIALQQLEKPILVGHSLGGVTISEAAEHLPEAIGGLVYVASVLLTTGACAMDLVTRSGQLPQGVRLSPDRASLIIDPEYARDRYYNGCDDDVNDAVGRLVPQPVRLMRDKVMLTSERYGSVRRAYIECLRDHAIPLAIQRDQYAATPCDPVLRIDTGHSPFLQAPQELSALLLAAAIAFGA